MAIEPDKKETEKLSAWQKHLNEYIADSMQRAIIFTDVLRKRGNNYIKHIRSGQPPVLTFNYELILNAKNFKRPVNYSLVRISDRRKKNETPEQIDRRHKNREHIPKPKRPIVIVDPRAGHGPGIGGSKRDSEIGMALEHGHPVYFILFYTDPIPGQTMADVIAAMERFMEKVAELHPDADAPAIMGNCQAGWAAALVCADRPDVSGLLVLNGAPLSYWSGVAGVNPMRYKGGLGGGVWMNSFLSDLGNGVFDGANLVLNFEMLNPANTFWNKQYYVYSQLDNEEDRFLAFERWWGGFFMLNSDEIHFIVNNLFVGNKLERGELELSEDKKVSLKNIRNPILVFASMGDNITPAQQALNWIPRVYSSVDDIKRHGQVIIYIVHKDIGHLGIFVAGSVAKKEHKEIIGNIDMIDFLPPGLYEMVIEGDIISGKFHTKYEPRTFADIASYDDGTEDEADFSVVSKVSEANDKMYQLFMRPWVKLWTTELSAEILRYLHPLRLQRYIFADINPLMRPVKNIASLARQNRKPVAQDNPFLIMEKGISEYIAGVLDTYRDYRDRRQEQLFQQIYGSDWLRWFFPPAKEEKHEEIPEHERADYDRRLLAMEEGGHAAGLIRIYMAVARSGEHVKRRHFEIATEIARTHKILSKLRPAQFKRIMQEQTAILQADEDKALHALSVLIKDKDERMEALSIARRLCLVDGVYTEPEKVMIEKIKKGLNL
ncbi:MAG: Alpha/beta hydrolase family protein [Smithella sp. PtaU1.Bin162]|nr:MAG: Alpha/beta hydrolase family protein [Smithella sp. PtaU1.Bin162]